MVIRNYERTSSTSSTARKSGDRRSRDARKLRKNGKGGKLLANGSLHHDAFDSYAPAALDPRDPNFVEEEEEELRHGLAFVGDARHGLQLRAALVVSARDAASNEESHWAQEDDSEAKAATQRLHQLQQAPTLNWQQLLLMERAEVSCPNWVLAQRAVALFSQLESLDGHGTDEAKGLKSRSSKQRKSRSKLTKSRSKQTKSRSKRPAATTKKYRSKVQTQLASVTKKAHGRSDQARFVERELAFGDQVAFSLGTCLGVSLPFHLQQKLLCNNSGSGLWPRRQPADSSTE